MRLRNVAGIVAVGLTVTAISGRSFTGRAPEPGTERVLFDVDLTTGQPGGGKVSGGAWDRGWKTTGAKNERIVFDAGKPIENGPPGDGREYDYWDHVDYTIEHCRRLGLYAIVLPTWGSGVTGGHNGERPEETEEIVFDPPSAYAYGRWLGERHRAEPHVIWMLGGDRSAVYGDRDRFPGGPVYGFWFNPRTGGWHVNDRVDPHAAVRV